MARAGRRARHAGRGSRISSADREALDAADKDFSQYYVVRRRYRPRRVVYYRPVRRRVVYYRPVRPRVVYYRRPVRRVRYYRVF